jgi:antitoxin component YwqK of YwqJK toxin-antitoxin module
MNRFTLALFLSVFVCVSGVYAQSIQFEEPNEPADSTSEPETQDVASPDPASEPEKKADSDLRTQILKDSYEVMTDHIDTIRTAKKNASTAAKSLGNSLSLYIKEKQIQKKQQELVYRFHIAFNDLTQGFNLNEAEREHLLAEVEKVYIKDAAEANKLDQTQFRDLPDIVQAKYSEMELERTVNGTVDTYYLSGALKTHWILKDGKPHGAIVTHYENGEMKFIDIYENGKKINRKKYNEEGKLEFEQNYDYVAPEVTQTILITQQENVTSSSSNQAPQKMVSIPVQGPATPPQR